MAKRKELNEIKDATGLKKKKTEALQKLTEMKLKNQIGQLANPLEIRKLRKEVARISTSISAASRKTGV